MNIKEVTRNSKYCKAFPFWSWNDKLEEKEMQRQIEVLNNAGISGFIMHARAGLETKYLSDEWYDAIRVGIDEAKKRGMDAWMYDEEGWPSGFAGGIVPKKGFEYWQKKINSKILSDDKAPEYTVALFKVCDNGYEKTDKAEKGVTAFYLAVNKYYIDSFNPDTIKYFLEVTHDEYYKRFGDEFGKTVKGFFTDENQFNFTTEFPWSHLFEEEFKKRYGYSLIDNLPALFGNYENTLALRYDFWRMVGDMFRTNCLKQLYDWCEEHNCMLTGHVMGEEGLHSQVRAVAETMPCYEYFHVPGIDWLSRNIGNAYIAKQLGSVAAQLNKSAVTETFGCSGWGTTVDDLRYIAAWQFVNGINVLCQHLKAYSLRGLRKRDCPPSFYMQMPWYQKAFPYFNGYFEKLGKLLSSCEETASVLVINPIYTASMLYEYMDDTAIAEYSGDFVSLSDRLNDEHILHHYGSEVLIERHGKVCENEITLGKCRYNKVLLPKLTVISSNTCDMLIEFAKNGGKIYALSVPQFIDGRKDDRAVVLKKICTVIDEETLSLLHDDTMPSLINNGKEMAGIHITQRVCADEKLFYALNLHKEKQTVEFSCDGEFSLCEFDVLNETKTVLDYKIVDGKTVATLSFEAREAKLILAEKNVLQSDKKAEETIKFQNEFSLLDCSDNMLTLDKCEYKISGGEWQEEKALILLFSDLLKRKQSCDLSLKFKFIASYLPKELFMLLETPKKFKISINGSAVSSEDIGYLIDKSFRKIDISNFVKIGVNEIVLDTHFEQNQEVYDLLFGENVHESELNKLSYDTELESIYIVGDFAVEAKAKCTYGNRGSVFAGREFEIVAQKDKIDIEDITAQGYFFFSGNISLAQNVVIDKKDDVSYKVKLSRLNAPAAELFVNGKSAGMFLYTPFMLDVTDLLVDGENEFVFKLYSSNRNLLGPHHRPVGEVYQVGPSSFTDEHGWCDLDEGPDWTEDYSFIKFGITF